MVRQEQELEEYVPWERHLRPHVPTFITRWVQIWWSNWLAQQWDSNEEIPFPNLAALWEKIDDGEPWKPTFLDRYVPKDLARGGTGVFGQLAIATGSAGSAGEATADTATIDDALRTRRAAESAAAVTAAAAMTTITRQTEAAAAAAARAPPHVSPGTPATSLNAMAFNLGYKQGRWEMFCNACGPVRVLQKSAEEASHVLPPSPLDPSCKSCVTYHMKGMCNEACLNAGDHRDHTREQDMHLWGYLRLALSSAVDPENPQE